MGSNSLPGERIIYYLSEYQILKKVNFMEFIGERFFYYVSASLVWD